MMNIQLPYGKGSIQFNADPTIANWHIVRGISKEPIQDLDAAFQEAFINPIGCASLADLIKPTDRVVIVTTDATRPFPNQLLLEQLIKFLNIPIQNITVLLGNGTHRKNSPKEIEEMFGYELANSLRILNHEADNPNQNRIIGKTASGGGVFINKIYLEADKRIVIGSIEPHFFTGFSGGAKGVFPAIAGIDTIFHLHRAELIANKKSTWGETSDNPIFNEIVEMGMMCPPDFLINVTLNSEKKITDIFAGQCIEAHKLGCEHVKETMFVNVPKKFPIVITSNSGYPLDQNLYQTVKGISAAAQIVEDGGSIFIASECSDGIPYGSNFAQIMQSSSSANDVLQSILMGRRYLVDQWQAQILSSILMKAEVYLYSSLEPSLVEACKLKPISDLQSSVIEKIKNVNSFVDVAVIPDGPITVPFIN